MFEFYRENLKYYLKIALYKYMLYLALVTPLFLLLVVAVSLLRLKFEARLINIAVVSIAVAPIIVGGLLLLMLVLKFLFITIYSLAKDQQESGRRFQFIFRVVRRLASPKWFLLVLFVLISGYVVYSQILPTLVPPNEINTVILSLALTLLIYSVLLILFSTRHLVISLVRALWEYLPGLVWRLLVALAIISSQLVILAAIYLVVSRILVPNMFT
jgi:hypothetical protein